LVGLQVGEKSVYGEQKEWEVLSSRCDPGGSVLTAVNRTPVWVVREGLSFAGPAELWALHQPGSEASEAGVDNA